MSIQGIVLVMTAIILGCVQTRFPNRSATRTTFLRPPAEISHFALGYRQALADSLWIRLLQDYDVCGKSAPTGDAQPKCEEGWVYHMLEAITNLDPQFKMAYMTGGTMLSVAIEDYVGAEKIFTKAMRRYPEDWVLPYRAAYNQLYGLKNNEKAATYLVTAGKNGAPSWVNMLAARLYTKSGQAMLGKTILEDFARTDPSIVDNPHYKDLLSQVTKDLTPEERLPSSAHSQK